MKNLKIVLLAVALTLSVLFALGLIASIREGKGTVPTGATDKDSRAERLKDPNLLYGYFSWSGMCINDRGEEGGCGTEKYLYLDGKYIEKNNWSGPDDKKEAEPTIKKQLDKAIVEKVKAEIRSRGLMVKDCSPVFTTDAGWDYFVNLDGVKRNFSNPPEPCSGALKAINEAIYSAQATVNGMDY